jgi:glycosyltransferase involved in cell wall biosynthesis
MKQKYTIAVVQQSPDFGGAETFMLNLMHQFSLDGHSVYFAANKSKMLQEAKKLSIHSERIPAILDIPSNIRGLIKSILRLPFLIPYYLSLMNKLKKAHTDFILMSGFSEKMLVTWLARKYVIPVIWIEYGPLEPLFKKNFRIPEMLYKSLKSAPKAIIVSSQYTAQHVIRDAGYAPDRVHVIPCGIPDVVRTSITRKSGVTIGSVSRLTREKGQHILIKAMPLILKKIPMPG